VETIATSFTPLPALLGGALIGLAAALLVLANGRAMGVSGILGGLFDARGENRAWRAAFVVGLLAGAWITARVIASAAEVSIATSVPLLVAGGLLVGAGTRIGSGCTSGHGVCGIARGSPRSLAATAVFFTVALATVFVSRHLVGGP